MDIRFYPEVVGGFKLERLCYITSGYDTEYPTIVWEATNAIDPSCSDRYAIKRVSQGMLSWHRESVFLKELSPHPNILRLVKSFKYQDDYLQVFEYLGRSTLPRTLSNETPLASYLLLMHDLAQGMMHMHGHGIVHRDIRAQNISIQESRPILIDFSEAARAGNIVSAMNFTDYISFFWPPEKRSLFTVASPSIDLYSFSSVLDLNIGETLFGDCNCLTKSEGLVSTGIRELARPLINYLTSSKDIDPRLRPKSAREHLNILEDIISSRKTELLSEAILEKTTAGR